MRINKKEWVICSFIFIMALVVYGGLAFKMKCTVFYPGDEALYINLAKSLHFTGTLTEHYQLRMDDDILYSMILSLAYFFYSPERILMLFRIIGVVLMCSTVFPAFLLAKNLNVGKIFKVDGSIFIAMLSVLIPEMTYTAYLLEEVLLYPLFMWSMWIVYMEFCDEDRLRRMNVWAIVLLFAMYTTKMFAMVFCCTYCLTLFVYGIIKKDKKIIVKSIVSGAIFLVLVIALKFFVYIINGMNIGNAKYSDQVMSVFPVTFQVIVGLVRGLFFYGSYFILFMGIVPVLALCSNFRKYDKKDILWAAYLLGMVCFTLLEIVTIIHYSENGTDAVVSRFHFRYLFYFFIPMCALLIKYRTIKSKTISSILSVFVLIALNVFFIPVSQNEQGICDGIACFFTKRMNVYSGFTDTLYMFIALFLVVIIILINKDKSDNVVKSAFVLIILCMLAIMPFTFKIPVENSENSSMYVDDYIKIAEYINETNGKIYYLSDGDYGDPIFRSSGYNIKDFKEMWVEENTEYLIIDENDTTILISGYFPYGFAGYVEEVNFDTSGVRVLKAQKGELLIDKSEYNITFYQYGNLINGYDKGGKRYLDNGGVSFGPFISLESGRYSIIVKGTNLNQSQMYAYSGSVIFELIEREHTDNLTVYELELGLSVDNFEFSVRNSDDEAVILDNIKIKRLQ